MFKVVCSLSGVELQSINNSIQQSTNNGISNLMVTERSRSAEFQSRYMELESSSINTPKVLSRGQLSRLSRAL